MATSTPKRILVTGFVSTVSLPTYFRDRFGPAEKIKAEIEADTARIQRAGITTVVFQIDPLQQEKSLQGLESILREGKYDAIGIGAGARLHPDYTALFESIVNICVRIAPGVPFLFNDGPGLTWEALERVFKIQIP